MKRKDREGSLSPGLYHDVIGLPVSGLIVFSGSKFFEPSACSWNKRPVP